MFDFSAEQAVTIEDRLQLLIAGPSGAGKSHLIGTYPGKTLMICLGGEVHGITAARRSAKALTAVYADRDKAGNKLAPDQAMDRLKSILTPEAIKAGGFELVAFDGLTELEKLVRATKLWTGMCTTAKGAHDSFKETPATITMMDDILTRLQNLQFELNVDIAVTCILDVKSTNNKTGEITEAQPRLQGYSVAEGRIQMFGDIVTIGVMQGANGSGRVIQMHTELKKKSVDGETDEVKKIFGITPRLQGVAEVPNFIKADLGAVLKLKGR
jgi:hypothetical protein